MEPLEIYNLIQRMVQKEIDDKLQTYAQKNQYKASDIPVHQHTGIESPRIDFGDLTGAPIFTFAPTDKPENGTIRLYESGATRRIYAFINGTWRYANLT